jgi:parallel beta-helix repeat protein
MDQAKGRTYCHLIPAMTLTLALILTTGQSSTFTVTAGDKIQDAIDMATPGDIILVESGIYFENLNITKNITLIGMDNGNGLPVIDALGLGSTITFSAPGTVLDGFCAQNALGQDQAAIKIMSDNNTVVNNTARQSHEMGIFLERANNNLLANNLVVDNLFGISVSNSAGNMLQNNLMVGNDQNFLVPSRGSCNQIDDTNLVDGKPVYFLMNRSDITIDASSPAGDIYCINCYNITVKDQELTDNWAAIYLYNTSFSNITGNRLQRNTFGIYLLNSYNNTIIENHTSENVYGIYISTGSFNNTVFNNTVTQNDFGLFVVSDTGSNQKNRISGNNLNNNAKNTLYRSASGTERRY